MRLLLTGASGFVGLNLLSSFPKDWDILAVCNRQTDMLNDFIGMTGLSAAMALSCDLTDPEQVKKIFARIGPDFDAVIHLAANGDPAWSVNHPAKDLTLAAISTINLLENISCDRFIYFSSGAVYDGLSGDISPTSVISPTLPYAVAKLAAESYVRFYAEKRGIINRYNILRFFGAYGPYELPRKIYGRLLRAFSSDGATSFTIRGNGENYIDAMYTDDMSEGIISLLDSDTGSFTADFASGAPVTLNHLVETAARVCGLPNLDIRHEGAVPEYIEFHSVDDTLERLVGFRTRIKLEDGLKRYLEWMKKSGYYSRPAK